jgi:hypothetical protein
MSFPFVQPYFGLGNSLQTAQAGGAGGAGVGGWVELGRTSGSRASGATLDVGSLPDKRYYMVLYETQGSSTHTCDYRLNGDSGSNYAYRANQNGTSETTTTSTNFMFGDYGGIALDKFAVAYFSNLDTKEKLGISHQIQQVGTGAATAPTRAEYVHKHAQTSNPISTISLLNRGPNTSASGEIVVLGWDPADTHTTNFWEELDSFTQTSASPSIDLTLTGKKYLWIQFFAKATTVTGVEMQFNSDTSSNYTERNSNDGASDATGVSKTKLERFSNAIGSGETCFGNTFIINNASNEKLSITHSVDTGTGSGATNVAGRREVVGKWANTSAQITALKFFVGNGNLDVGSTIKVWGSD